jgi:RHS repeat-associated protein
MASEQLDGGEQEGVFPNTPHDYLMREYTVKEAGYAFLFVSNENPTLVNVYFDDVTFTHTPTQVIQYNEFYPYGLQTAQSWTRENVKGNNYLYNSGSELNTTTNNYEMFFREYDPALGRMNAVDPMASKYASLTPYNYAFSNPVAFNDPSGADPLEYRYQREEEIQRRKAMSRGRIMVNNNLNHIYRGGSMFSMFNSGWSPSSGSLSAGAFASGNSYFAYKESKNDNGNNSDSFQTSDPQQIKLILMMASQGYYILYSDKSNVALGHGLELKDGSVLDIGDDIHVFDVKPTIFDEDLSGRLNLFLLGATVSSNLAGDLLKNVSHNFKILSQEGKALGINFSKEIEKVSKYIKGVKIGGAVLSLGGLWVTYNDYDSKKISPLEASIDGTFGIMGLIPHPITIGLSISYFSAKGALEASGYDAWNYRIGAYGNVYNSKTGKSVPK